MKKLVRELPEIIGTLLTCYPLYLVVRQSAVLRGNASTLKIERTTTENIAFRVLEKKLDEELYTIYGEMQNNYSSHNIVKDLKTIIIYDVQKPIACGLFKVS